MCTCVSAARCLVACLLGCFFLFFSPLSLSRLVDHCCFLCDLVTCHFCVYAVCGERASGKSPDYFNDSYFPAPHVGLFLPLLWPRTEENPLCKCVCVLECVCLCVYIYMCACVCVCVRPRTSSPLMLQREASLARRTPDWQAHRTPTQPIHAHVCARSHMLLNTRELHTRWCRCTTTFKYIKHTQNPSVRTLAFNPPFF